MGRVEADVLGVHRDISLLASELQASSLRKQVPRMDVFDDLLLTVLFWNQWRNMFSDYQSGFQFCDLSRLGRNLTENCRILADSYHPSTPNWFVEKPARALFDWVCPVCLNAEYVSLVLCETPSCMALVETTKSQLLKYQVVQPSARGTAAGRGRGPG